MAKAPHVKVWWCTCAAAGGRQAVASWKVKGQGEALCRPVMQVAARIEDVPVRAAVEQVKLRH